MSAENPAPEPHLGSLARTVSRNVLALMATRHVSQQKLADAVGLPQTGISKRLRGQQTWTLHDVEAVALAFGVPWSELLRQEEADEGEAPPQLRTVGRPRPRARAHTGW